MMILRRPYAFLTRHIRFIHAILLICGIFLLYKTVGIVSFFGSYIRNNASSSIVENASNYVTSWMYISCFLIAIDSLIVMYLLNHKHKKIILYISVLLFYILLMISFFLLSSFLYDLQFNNPSIRLINIIRDAFRFTLVVQAVAVGFFFVRTLGFDLKHFDFKKDVLDLGIEQKDNEEYEFEFRFDKESVKSNLNKKIRYFKYFYKENKFVFIFIYSVIFIVIFSLVVKYYMGLEKVYKEGEYFSDNYFNMKVLDSYKVKDDSKATNKNFYIIVKIDFQNKTSYEQLIGTNYLKLSYGDYELTQPTVKLNSSFTEFGVNYFAQTLKANEERTFNFIFEVPKEYYNDGFYLKYLYEVKYLRNETEYKYRKIKLSLKEFNDDKENVTTTSLGNEMSFDKSILGNTKITINDIELNDKFYYNMIKCSNSVCDTRRNTITATASENIDLTLMRIHYNIDYDYDTLGSRYTNDSFISKFGTIRFEINGKEYNNRVVLRDVTPFKTNDYSFIEVRDKLKRADKIYLDFTIRDKVYTYVIKDNLVNNDS